jgi:hypothetical protein
MAITFLFFLAGHESFEVSNFFPRENGKKQQKKLPWNQGWLRTRDKINKLLGGIYRGAAAKLLLARIPRMDRSFNALLAAISV